MLGEHAMSRIRMHISGCIQAFRTYAFQYQFEEAEAQLALLGVLTNQFPDVDLEVSLAELTSLLLKYKEKQGEEQKNIEKELAAVKAKAVQEVREEMQQKIQEKLQKLENMLSRSSFSTIERARIRTIAAERAGNILDGIGKS
jgi:hypothetical protein